MRKPGDHGKTEPVAISLNQEYIAWLNEIKSRTGMGRTAYIKMLIDADRENRKPSLEFNKETFQRVQRDILEKYKIGTFLRMFDTVNQIGRELTFEDLQMLRATQKYVPDFVVESSDGGIVVGEIKKAGKEELSVEDGLSAGTEFEKQ